MLSVLKSSCLKQPEAYNNGMFNHGKNLALPGEDEEEEEEELEKEPSIDKKIYIFALIFFVIALVARLIFIFGISTPDNPGAGWFGDAYHHWQIAYLSKEIGFSNGFLRLWDLKGMEFFWGLLHPLVTIAAFVITGSISIGVERAATALFGSFSVSLVFLIVHKYWNSKAAFAAATFAALNPIGVFNDGSGMVEPLGIPFLLLGVYLWPRKAWLAGVSFAVALMGRSEYWVFSLFLIAAMIVFGRKAKFDSKIFLFFGFFFPLIAYMKFLLNYTASAVYPLYLNYLTNIFGTWQLKDHLDPQDIVAKYVFLTILAVSVVAAVVVLWKRPRGMFMYLLGLGNWMFLGATFGLGQYIKSYADYVWYVRFMILPYMFIGIVVSVMLFYTVPKIKVIKYLDKLHITTLAFLGFLGVSQLFWIPIMTKYNSTEPNWRATVTLSQQIAANYHGGGLLLMDGNPEITYALAKLHNIPGRVMVSVMFDPYFYFPAGEDPYAKWEDYRAKVLTWLITNDIRTIVTYSQYERYTKLAEFEPEYISTGSFIPNSNIVIYQVSEKLFSDPL